MKIDHVLQRTKAPDLNQTSKTDTAKETGTVKGQNGLKIKTDTVIISEEARTLQRAESELKAQNYSIGTADTQTPVRKDKVEAAKAKIAAGQLLLDKVVEDTADAILKSGSLEDIINSDKLLQKRKLSGIKAPETGADNLSAIKEKIESGFYSSPEVVDKIAERMIDDLLA
jgi:anti-sigma28 factor (negative regulator of flagellin synthesis)